MFGIFATIDIKPDQRDSFLAVSEKLQEPSNGQRKTGNT
jgi:quinol monooxygenase YgiN